MFDDIDISNWVAGLGVKIKGCFSSFIYLIIVCLFLVKLFYLFNLKCKIVKKKKKKYSRTCLGSNWKYVVYLQNVIIWFCDLALKEK